jgi:hypothetical protein
MRDREKEGDKNVWFSAESVVEFFSIMQILSNVKSKEVDGDLLYAMEDDEVRPIRSFNYLADSALSPTWRLIRPVT